MTATTALLLAALAAGGPITGVVHLAPVPSLRPPLTVTQDEEACGAQVPDESLVVDAKGGVANAVVYLEKGDRLLFGRGPKSSLSPLLDQKGCRFTPHVLAAQTGATLVALNSDPVLHTVHATGAHHRFAFDAAMPFQGARKQLPLDRPGTFALTCNAGHRWMKAWLKVFDHPYFAVTDAHGHFALPSVPPGTYSVVVWQERLGERRLEVTVGEAGAAPITVELSPEPPKKETR